MSARKVFAAGENVEVKRDTTYVPWEPATYISSQGFKWRGWHKVLLPPGAGRYVDSMSGSDLGCDTDGRGPLENPRATLTHYLLVPTRRLRKVSP